MREFALRVAFVAALVLLGGCRAVSPEGRAVTQVECLDQAGKHLLVQVGRRNVLRYNYGVVHPPEGVDEIFARSGYIHPVWTPSGRVISNDMPGQHLHHHGIWFPWTSSVFEGRKVDFWNSKKGEGKVECVSLDQTTSGPKSGGWTARHRFIDLTAPGQPKVALEEIWTVKVYASDTPFMFDLVSIQTCATSSPLVIRKYRYGGMGFRGSSEWEGKDGVAFLTSEGRTREDGHGTRARWCVMHGKVEGGEVSIGFLCHPANFRFPQPMRIHPDEPFFNFAPSQLGDFRIEPDKPYVSRYRFLIRDGIFTANEMERYWKEYAAH